MWTSMLEAESQYDVLSLKKNKQTKEIIFEFETICILYFVCCLRVWIIDLCIALQGGLIYYIKRSDWFLRLHHTISIHWITVNILYNVKITI